MATVVSSGEKVEFVGDIDVAEDAALAARIAQRCSVFSEDDEDECYAIETVSCFNCRSRRWTVDGFTCGHERLTEWKQGTESAQVLDDGAVES